MLINLEAPISFESSVSLDSSEEIFDSDNNAYKNLNFTGYLNFNKEFVLPIFRLLANKSQVYRLCHVKSNTEMSILEITNTKTTYFIFKVLKALGISLNELRIGYKRENKTHIKLYLHPKIIALINKSNKAYVQQLVYYLYCNIVFFSTINTHNLEFSLSYTDNVVVSNIAEFNNFINIYNENIAIAEPIIIECDTFKDDMEISSITYSCNNLTKPLKAKVGTQFNCDYVYNILETEKGKILIIVNKSFSTYEYYIINTEKGIILTNSSLQPYNVLSTSEWLPHLLTTLAECTEYRLSGYTIKYRDTARLLSSIEGKVVMSCDAQEYGDLLEQIGFVNENYKVNLYSDLMPKATITTDTELLNFEEYYKSDALAQQLYKQIQDYYKDVDLQDLTGIVKGFIKGEVYSMLFEGEAGTGKSTAARVIPSKCGLPFIVINCSVNVEESDIFGSMIPNPYKKTAEDPEFIWKDGPATTAIRHGYALILEEIGGARPGVLMKLNSLLDESRQIDLSNGEILHAHPNFRVIATTNIGYEGTNRLNKALVDRFEICKKFKEPSNTALANIVMSRTGYSDIIKINKVLDVYSAIKKYSNEQNLGLVVSVRELLNIFKQGKYYKSAKDAVTCMLLNKAFLEEPIHLEYFVNNIFKAFDLAFKI